MGGLVFRLGAGEGGILKSRNYKDMEIKCKLEGRNIQYSEEFWQIALGLHDRYLSGETTIAVNVVYLKPIYASSITSALMDMGVSAQFIYVRKDGLNITMWPKTSNPKLYLAVYEV